MSIIQQTENQKKNKKDNVSKTSSLRSMNKTWRRMHISVGAKREMVPIDNLLDIGRNTVKLTGRELAFYNDQQGKRECRLSEEVDDEWVIQQAEQQELQEQEAQHQIVEEMYEDEEKEDCEIFQLDKSLNRSYRVFSCDNSTQTDNTYVPQPRTRDCTDEIKSSCVQVSVNCGISAKMSTIAIQTVCKSLYNHKFYLTKDEAIAEDPDLISYKKTEDREGHTQSKRQKLMTGKTKPPTSKEVAILSKMDTTMAKITLHIKLEVVLSHQVSRSKQMRISDLMAAELVELMLWGWPSQAHLL